MSDNDRDGVIEIGRMVEWYDGWTLKKEKGDNKKTRRAGWLPAGQK
jgi:hypothetical protein